VILDVDSQAEGSADAQNFGSFHLMNNCFSDVKVLQNESHT